MTVLSIIIMVLMIILFIVTFKRWYELLNIKKDVIDKSAREGPHAYHR